uniref:Sugar phosphate phosphatase n=1 Tax=Elaeophora elaphi TaxID=1147741 RepID=A0A0R3S481_9BILA
MPPIPSIPPTLTGCKEGTFAFLTVRDRWPKILGKIVDQVYRYRHAHIALHGEEGEKDIKSVLSQLSELTHRVSTDKELQDLSDDGEKVNIWNEELSGLRMKKGAKQVTWFRSDWLFAECFLYRQVISLFLKTTTLKEFDPFASQKQSSFISCEFSTNINTISMLTKRIEEVESETAKIDHDIILHFFQLCLWGNTCDLSLSSGEHVASLPLLDMVDQLADKILCNQLDEVDRILRNGEVNRVDIILDNSGLELFGDLALAELLIAKGGVKKIIFHGKSMPWFVSDVTGRDFNWTIEMLIANSDHLLKNFGVKCSQRLCDNEFAFQTHYFWTLPYPYYLMAEKAPDLHRELSQSSLIIFKGDYNYRKLVSDLEWPLDTPFKVALRGFAPAPILALRTIKAETLAGLSPSVIENLQKKYGNEKIWMTTGEYAIAQFAR